uniref:Uncharacterized protein n=1 Tax=Knipowitschia caucasica TaxID=637954 RepID=A0AAV2L7K9_KNICA
MTGNIDAAKGGTLGPTLGLVKSSSLESLQTAMEEVRQSSGFPQVPFHKPRAHMVRGRGCNMSFRHAIDKSYEGPSEDDDDLSDHSSGHETPASTSSRNDLDADESNGKKNKKTKGKKKDKKMKVKKEPVEEVDRKKKKGFGLLRFGKKKDDKTKGSKTKLDALSEEELDRTDHRDSPGPRSLSGPMTPDYDDDDPFYARINDFRQPPPQLDRSRSPSPAPAALRQRNPTHASAEDLEGLYAKVNKAKKSHHPSQDEGGQREYHNSRAVPGYDQLDAARRRALEYDPNRMAPRQNETRPSHHYEEIDRQFLAQARRDPYDYPRPVDLLPPPQSMQYHPASPHPEQRGRPQQYEPRREGHRQASPGRYIEQDPRRKNAVIGAV